MSINPLPSSGSGYASAELRAQTGERAPKATGEKGEKDIQGKQVDAPGEKTAENGGKKSTDPAAKKTGKTELTPEQLEQIRKLKTRDTEVRQHEQAHLAASGGLAVSGASYSYQKGPDGVNYAIGGEVSIDTSPGRTPEDTIARARTIQAAALAPAEPSGPDQAVAAKAQQMEQAARGQLMQKQIQGGFQKSDLHAKVLQAYGATDKADSNASSLSVYA